jgi:hypothetical protein
MKPLRLSSRVSNLVDVSCRVQASPSRGFRSSASRSTVQAVDLAYDLHVQGRCKADPGTCNPPIVFIHGLFGSKANNRSISK